MKNAHKLVTLLFFTTLFISCTPQDISDNETTTTQELFGTGDDQDGGIDNDRDEDGD